MNVVGIRTFPFGWLLAEKKSGLSMTCELVAKFVPVMVIAWPFVFTEALGGLTLEIVESPERTLKVNELLFAELTDTET